jgi:hypothetical protein
MCIYCAEEVLEECFSVTLQFLSALINEIRRIEKIANTVSKVYNKTLLAIKVFIG